MPKWAGKPITETRFCNGCRNDLPRTSEFFYRDRTHRDGLGTRCKKCVDRTNDLYAKRHAEATAEYQKRYRLSHAARMKQQFIECKAKNKDRALQIVRDWRLRNPGLLPVQKRWRLRNPEAVKLMTIRSKHRRRAREVNAISDQKIDYKEIYDCFGGICGVCDEHVPFSVVTFDHIVPLSRGGQNTVLNLLPSHKRCNQIKGDRSLSWARHRVRELAQLQKRA